MSFRTRRVLYSTPFVMLYEFFLMKYFFMLFGGLDDLYLLLLTFLYGFLKISPIFFEERKSRFITRTFEEISGIWVWVSLYILFALLIIYLPGRFIEIPFWFIVLVLLIVCIITVYSYLHAHRIIIHEKTIELENLDEDINIAHLSDIHFGSIMHDKIILNLRDKLNEVSACCDLAIISGDLADGSCVIEEDDFMPLKEVNMPLVFTAGNHDFYRGIESVYRACENAGIIILDNEGMEFKNLNIFGLTFSFEDIETVGADELAAFVREDMVNIINFHVPRNWENFSRMGFDIQLSGHSHGGQFYPVVWIGNLIAYNMGLFKKVIGGKDRYLHVSTGVGCMDYPFRWGTDSEIVVLKLRRK